MSAAFEQIDISLCLASVTLLLVGLCLTEQRKPGSTSRRSWRFLFGNAKSSRVSALLGKVSLVLGGFFQPPKIPAEHG